MATTTMTSTFGATSAMSSFAVDDLAAARAFYAEVLGLEVTEEAMGFLTLHLGGTDVLVYPKPDHAPAVFTVLSFAVPDIDRAVADLAGRGIAFERYDAFDHDEHGVVRSEEGPPIAWFTDPCGNVLAVLEDPSGQRRNRS